MSRVNLEDMTKSEYLQFLINYHYVNYRNSKIIMSVFDADKKLRFTTKYREMFFNAEISELYGCTPIESKANLRIKSSQSAEILEEMLDVVIKNKTVVRGILFDDFGDKQIALHNTFEPILNHKNELCGVKAYAHDFTQLFFSCHRLPKSNPDANLISKLEMLNKLTDKQKSILHLLSVGFNLQEVSKFLKVSRGTISKTIMQIGAKLGVNSYSAQEVLDLFGARVILENTNMPKIDIPRNAMIFLDG